MSRLTDLLRQVRNSDAQLGADLEKEVTALTKRRSFGLVFERHQPEAVEIPHQPIRRGAKVRKLPARADSAQRDDRIWRVESVAPGAMADREAELIEIAVDEPERTTARLDDLVVVLEFEDKIYPGLAQTGTICRGSEDAFHTVINAENFHALEMLTYTHRSSVDLIYIDPPYNTGNAWIYNDNYVASGDDYRHSKWLAFMERRLRVAADLLTPDGVLCISTGSDEVHRLELLVEQLFPAKIVQIIAVQVTAGGKSTAGINTLNEYLVCATPEDFIPGPTSFTGGVSRTPWEGLVLATFTREQRPNQAYPIFVDCKTGALHSVGPSLTSLVRSGNYAGELADFKYEVEAPEGTVALWPITSKGEERVWRLAPDRFANDWAKGYIKISENQRRADRNRFSIQYLPAGVIKKVESGDIQILGKEEGLPTLLLGENRTAGASLPSIWTEKSFRTSVGTDHLKTVLGGKDFPYPKPVPLIADVIRGFLPNLDGGTVLDYFAGSGTTLEAVLAANSADGGSRKAIIITNNEVSALDSKRLRASGYRKGDLEWEERGVYQAVTRPRIQAISSGISRTGERFSDGYSANISFFDLTYETPLSVRHNRSFDRIAPLLWMRAGSVGRVISSLADQGWDTSETYAVLEDLDQSDEFLERVRDTASIRMVFVITDDDAAFQMVCRELPSDLNVVRLYESYVQNFELNRGRNL